jgi:hypothetical protein
VRASPSDKENTVNTNANNDDTRLASARYRLERVNDIDGTQLHAVQIGHDLYQIHDGAEPWSGAMTLDQLVEEAQDLLREAEARRDDMNAMANAEKYDTQYRLDAAIDGLRRLLEADNYAERIGVTLDDHMNREERRKLIRESLGMES